ncbi:hypothetical protein C0991_003955 [Blastosporella zonata]|nr:hypothetical protein C0991_003955 [Blastosporella zonata]
MSARKRTRAGSLSVATGIEWVDIKPTCLGRTTSLPLAALGRSTGSVPLPPTHATPSDISPASTIKLLLVPIVLYVNWELSSPYLAPGVSNPFAAAFFVPGRISSSSNDDPRYAKSYYDLVFLAYNIVFFSLVRQLIAVNACRPIAKYFGLRREAKIDRFGEQGYALVYFAFFGAWGYRVMTQLPTNWYETKYFWIDYPHWDMKPELKRYYLMQMAYWCQQLLVLVLGLEKPRKDYNELIAHHFVTIWLVGWSYMLNMTLIGNAVYMSMDIPDAFLAFSKLLNYIQWERAKVYSFLLFFAVWTYFRHYLNIKILWSVWYELPLFMPEEAKVWDASKGVYFVWWLRYQVFIPIALLQCINLFWYRLMARILWRAIRTSEADDSRSDDEGDDDDDAKKD